MIHTDKQHVKFDLANGYTVSVVWDEFAFADPSKGTYEVGLFHALQEHKCELPFRGICRRVGLHDPHDFVAGHVTTDEVARLLAAAQTLGPPPNFRHPN